MLKTSKIMLHRFSILHSIIACFLLFAFWGTACSDSDDFRTDKADALVLSTRAMADASTSKVAVRLYAIRDTTRGWNVKSNNLALTSGDKESDVYPAGSLGQVAATGGNATGSVPAHFKYKGWYFYGITVSTADDPASVASVTAKTFKKNVTDQTRPYFHFDRGEKGLDPLPDVRVAIPTHPDSMESTQNGVVEMNFKHAMARLKIIISHPSTTNNGAPWTTTYYLRQLTLHNYTGGTFDLSNNQWTHTGAGDTIQAVPLLDGTDDNLFAVDTISRTVVEDVLIFPTKVLTITSRMDNLSSDGKTYEKEWEAKADTVTLNGKPLEFLANRTYTLTLQYLYDGMHIITANPDYYDYVDATTTSGSNSTTTSSTLTSDMSVGTPTLFNGVVWADRNLGATSATYSTIPEWEEMRGYYYQVGRNIPYKVYPIKKYHSDVSDNNLTKVYKYSDGTEYYWVQSNGDATGGTTGDKGRYLYPYIPGVWEAAATRSNYTSFSERSEYDFTNAANVVFYDFNLKQTSDITKRNVVGYRNGSSGSILAYYYLMVPDTILSPLTDGELSRYRFMHNEASKTHWSPSVTNLWLNASTNTSPCPPGWRLPSAEEWRGIMPTSRMTGDITFNPVDTSASTNAAQRVTHQHYDKSANQLVWYEENKDDPSVGYTSRYYCYRTSTAQSVGTLYIIKKYGTDEAYGLRITVDMKTLLATNSEEWPDAQGTAVHARSVLLIEHYTFSGLASQASFYYGGKNDSDNNLPEENKDASIITSKDVTGETCQWYRVEQLKFPISGVAQYNFLTLIWSGTEAQYISSDGYIVRMKVGGSTGSRYVMVDAAATTKSCCVLIRPVRDAVVAW